MTEEFISLKLDQYMTQFGQSEAIDLMQRLGKSRLFNENLQIALNAYDVPGAKAISGIIYSSDARFLLAKKRKVYFSSLFFLKVLCEKYKHSGMVINELKLSKCLMDLSEMYSM